MGNSRANPEARRLAALLIGFILGLLLTFALVVVASVYVGRASSWWNAVDIGLHLVIFLPLLGGLAFGAGAATIVDHFSYRNGLYKCWRCGRTLQRARTPCICWPTKREASVEQSRFVRWILHATGPTLRHLRRRATFITAVYLLLIPPALILVPITAVPTNPDSYLLRLVTGHVIFCAGGAFILEGAISILELLKRGTRFRLRARILVIAFAIWPVAFACGMILIKGMKVR
jgi:hypothetical protein